MRAVRNRPMSTSVRGFIAFRERLCRCRDQERIVLVGQTRNPRPVRKAIHALGEQPPLAGGSGPRL